jgi:hypothetical protein
MNISLTYKKKHYGKTFYPWLIISNAIREDKGQNNSTPGRRYERGSASPPNVENFLKRGNLTDLNLHAASYIQGVLLEDQAGFLNLISQDLSADLLG